MQPWDFVVIRDESIRREVQKCFLETNQQAAQAYAGEQRALYDSLKLAGILDAPINVCVTCDRARTKGFGLGRRSDPATDLYSTACAVQNLWLAARTESLGVGWVSILDPDQLRALLDIPAGLVPVAYLCIGYVSEYPLQPELESSGWERRERLERLIHFDRWGCQDEQRASALLSDP
jgi:5,6-dimethylbenzimidazole synthase